MSGRKPIYLLAGGRGSSDMGPVFDMVFSDVGKRNPTIAYVGAASGDSPDFFERIAGMLTSGRRCRVTHAILAPEEADVPGAIATIESADAVFVSGGDVEAASVEAPSRRLPGRLNPVGSRKPGVYRASVKNEEEAAGLLLSVAIRAAAPWVLLGRGALLLGGRLGLLAPALAAWSLVTHASWSLSLRWT